jgi:PhzF family phenazine biosynthesis protein
MDFPARPTTPVEAPPNLAQALGALFSYVGKNVDDYLVEVESEAVVRALRPDFDALSRLPVRGVIVTSQADPGEFDFISRFFAPAVGVNEDPVTGSSHTCLTPYWAEKLGKTELTAYQASPRGGVLRLRLAGERVYIAGQAVTVFRGRLLT